MANINKTEDNEEEMINLESFPKTTANNEIISDEINDIISNEPHWMIRHGVSLVGVAFLLLTLCCFFARYPDKTGDKLLLEKLFSGTIDKGK